jgi:hypothetical protein
MVVHRHHPFHLIFSDPAPHAALQYFRVAKIVLLDRSVIEISSFRFRWYDMLDSISWA